MKKSKSYSEAIKQLEKTVQEIESGELTVDQLTDKVKEASLLVQQCRKQLRSIEDEINETLNNLE